MKLLILLIIAVSINYLCLTKQKAQAVTVKGLLQNQKLVSPIMSKQSKVITINLK